MAIPFPPGNDPRQVRTTATQDHTPVPGDVTIPRSFFASLAANPAPASGNRVRQYLGEPITHLWHVLSNNGCGEGHTECEVGEAMIDSDLREMKVGEKMLFLATQYGQAAALVVHEDQSTFAKLKSMFDMQVVLLGVAAFVTTSAHVRAASPVALSVAAAAGLFIAWGYGLSISEGLACLKMHKSRLTLIEDAMRANGFRVNPLLVKAPKRVVLRYGPAAFFALRCAILLGWAVFPAVAFPVPK